MTGIKKFIISQIVLPIPLIWIGELQLLFDNESFHTWLIATVIMFIGLGIKIKMDTIENPDGFHYVVSFILIVICGLCWVVWFGGLIMYFIDLFGGWGGVYGFLYVMSFLFLADTLIKIEQ